MLIVRRESLSNSIVHVFLHSLIVHTWLQLGILSRNKGVHFIRFFWAISISSSFTSNFVLGRCLNFVPIKSHPISIKNELVFLWVLYSSMNRWDLIFRFIEDVLLINESIRVCDSLPQQGIEVVVIIINKLLLSILSHPPWLFLSVLHHHSFNLFFVLLPQDLSEIKFWK